MSNAPAARAPRHQRNHCVACGSGDTTCGSSGDVEAVDECVSEVALQCLHTENTAVYMYFSVI